MIKYQAHLLNSYRTRDKTEKKNENKIKIKTLKKSLYLSKYYLKEMLGHIYEVHQITLHTMCVSKYKYTKLDLNKDETILERKK